MNLFHHLTNMKFFIFLLLMMTGCTYRPYVENNSGNQQDRFSQQTRVISQALYDFTENPTSDTFKALTPKKESEQYLVYFLNQGYQIKLTGNDLVFNFKDRRAEYQQSKIKLESEQKEAEKDWVDESNKISSFFKQYRWFLVLGLIGLALVSAAINPSPLEVVMLSIQHELLQKLFRKK